MTKFERAIAELKKLPPDQQEAWAAMILQNLEHQTRYALTDEQVAEVKRRLAEEDPKEMTLEEFEDFVVRLTA
jgi:putative addiction module component (TIGR02574 family)